MYIVALVCTMIGYVPQLEMDETVHKKKRVVSFTIIGYLRVILETERGDKYFSGVNYFNKCSSLSI